MSEKKFLSFWGMAIIFALGAIITSCDLKKSVGLEDSLRPISNITVIEGAESSSITVNRSSDSYFKLEIGNINPNKYVKSGEHKGWCIAWNQPIQSNNAQYDGIKLYSTFQDENWKPINYLLNIRPMIQMQDPGISFREIQVAIWTLLDFPNFDLKKLRIDDLPSSMVRDGQYNFDRRKVDHIVNLVLENYSTFEYNSATTFAVVAETPSDTQTVIIETGETVWAYGQHSFRNQELRDRLGITGTGKGQWGWIYELDGSHATTELIAGGGDDDGTKAADEVGTIVGSLEMSKSGNDLDVTYSLSSKYLISDLHLWVGCSLEEFPWIGTTGNVAPGGFPYHSNGEPVNSYSFSVDLSTYSCSGNIFIAAHAGDLYKTVEIQLPDEPILEPVFSITNLGDKYGFIVAWDINDSGHIVGANSYWNSDTQTMINMGSIFARSINNHGQVAGSNKKWDINTGLIDLGMLPNDSEWLSEIEPWKRGIWVQANDINNNGQVVGEIWYENFLFEDCFYLDVDEEYYHCEDFYDYGSKAFYWEISTGMISLSQETSDRIDYYAEANGINDSGWVVGRDLSFSNRSFIWDEINGLRELNLSGAIAINNNGQILGRSQILQYSDESELVTKQSTKSMENLNLIDKVHRLTQTKGVYDFGHVVEMFQNSTFESEAFAWESGSKNKINNADSSIKNFVMSEGTEAIISEIVQNSTYSSEAFIYTSHGTTTNIGSLGGSWTAPWDINDHGQVVGYGDIGNEQSRAFLWDPEHGMIELPTLGGNSLARALNNEGQIVGYSYDSNGRFHPVMWEVSFGAQKFVVSNR